MVRGRVGSPWRPHSWWRRRHGSLLIPRWGDDIGRKQLLAIVAAVSTLAIATPALADTTGPDVSSWQHPKSQQYPNGAPINWTQVRGDGRTFAFVKATEDTTYTNPYFASDWPATKAAGLYRGAYHFARPASSALDQAAYFANAIGNQQEAGDLPPVLDLEDTGGLAPPDLVAWTRTFLTRLQDITGRIPMIYVSPNFWTNAMGDSHQFTGYPLWIARWTSASNPYPLPGGWSSWTFWQYTDVGSIPGINGAVDISRFNGDDAALAAFATSFSDTRCAVQANPVVAATGPDRAVWSKQGGGWCALGGTVIDVPAVTAIPQTGGLAIPLYIATGTDHDLWIRTVGQGWRRLSSQPLYCIGNPAATIAGAAGSAMLHVACEGGDHALWYGRAAVATSGLPTTAGSDWQPLGGRLSAGPAVAVVTGDSSPTFFVTGTDGRIWTRGVLSPYIPFGATCIGHPAASTNGSASYFACDGTDHGLWFAANLGGGWGVVQPGGGTLIDGPGIAVKSGAATIYVEGSDGAVWHLAVSGGTPTSGWATDYGHVDHGVSAVSPS
jgi:lysozyme